MLFAGDDRKCGITSDKGWIPDYCHDLNACHEMEKLLPAVKRISYGMELRMICGIWPDVTFATARQRCEAFVEVMTEKQ